MVRLLISFRNSRRRERKRFMARIPHGKQRRLRVGTHLLPHSFAFFAGVRARYLDVRWNSDRLLRVVSWILLGLCLAGCSRLPGKSDYNTARSALEGALEQWKLGSDPAEWRAQSKIVAGDPEWESGIKLKNYVIDDEVFDDGRNYHFKAILELVIKDGEVQKREGSYIVATNPVITVFRNEM